MAGASQEYVVRAPNENSKRFNVMRFANSLNIDVTKWKCARMEKERSLKQQEKVVTEEAPKFGFGSEYGKDAKEEARRKKYGYHSKKNRVDDCPWILKVGGKIGKKFKGTREGGVTENTSYYVFFQAHDGAFEAFPVSEWYNFSPIPRYKALTAEEAEEQFEKRDKILNHFAVMAYKKKQDGLDAEASLSETKLLKNIKKEKEFKVTEMDEWDPDSERSGDESDDDGEDTKMKKNAKGKSNIKGKGKKKAGKKKKGSDEDDDDSEPGEESDEGDFDTREVDYMSDTSSSSEEEEPDEKLNKEMKGVEDEDALRQLVLSDDSEEEEEEGDKAKADQLGPVKKDGDEAGKVTEIDGKPKVKQEKSGSDSGTSASDDSDDSDFDDSKFQSAMFMQRKTGSSTKNKNGSDQSASSSRANTPMTEQSGQQASAESKDCDSKAGANKRKLGGSVDNSPNISNKKPRTNDSGNGGEAITEEAVRRYLMRKPMTTTELLQKFKGKKIPLKGEDLVQTIARILKKLNPDKQTIKGKLHLYLKPVGP